MEVEVWSYLSRKNMKIIPEDHVYEKMNENDAIKETKISKRNQNLLNNEDVSWGNLTKNQSKTSIFYG